MDTTPEFTLLIICANWAKKNNRRPPRIVYNDHCHLTFLFGGDIYFMQEKDIFDERQEIKTANFACPNCRERNDYEVRWLKRTKKRNSPRNLNENDRRQLEKSRDYMVRVDDQLMCKNIRCRRRFDIPSSQSIVFI